MPSDTRTPDDIERDIERERSELAGSIDELQGRFSPEYVIREITRGFREHGGDIGTAVTRSVKQNPVALALTGVGLAWMMFGRSHSEPDDPYEERHRRYGGDLDHSRHAAATAQRREYGKTDDEPRRVGERTYTPSQFAARSRVYKTYPSWARHDFDDDEVIYGDDASDGGSFGQRVSDAASSVSSGARSAAGSVGDSASSGAGAVLDGAKSAASGVRNAASSAAERANRARLRLVQGTEDLSEAARERVIAARARAVEMAREVDSATRRGAQWSRDTASDFVEEQPLVAGALALAVGAALAGALPRSRREDEIVGETRDKFFDEAERIFEEEREKAAKVASAALAEGKSIVEEKRQKADDSAPGTKSAVEAAADEVRDAAGRIGDAAKSEADRQKLGEPST
jgi:hypothetical protein